VISATLPLKSITVSPLCWSCDVTTCGAGGKKARLHHEDTKTTKAHQSMRFARSA
jgi:hypothetical protein